MLEMLRFLGPPQTLRAQDRPVLEYLVEPCRAARQGLPVPSLLPSNVPTP
jgi:hypothetical protein